MIMVIVMVIVMIMVIVIAIIIVITIVIIIVIVIVMVIVMVMRLAIVNIAIVIAVIIVKVSDTARRSILSRSLGVGRPRNEGGESWKLLRDGMSDVAGKGQGDLRPEVEIRDRQAESWRAPRVSRARGGRGPLFGTGLMGA